MGTPDPLVVGLMDAWIKEHSPVYIILWFRDDSVQVVRHDYSSGRAQAHEAVYDGNGIQGIHDPNTLVIITASWQKVEQHRLFEFATSMTTSISSKIVTIR